MLTRKPANGASRITLSELAKRLGLSKTTVSVVLNDSPLAQSIAPETRERILRMAEKERYRPNFFARYLNNKRSMTIGVISPDIGEGYVAEVFAGIEEQLMGSPYQVFVSSHQWSPERLERSINFHLERGIEGLILINSPLPFDVDVPVVTIGGYGRPRNGTRVTIDNRAGIKEALAHLVSLGHRNIVFIKGHEGSADTEQRWKAIQQTARELSVRVTPQLTVQLKRLGTQHVTAIQEGSVCATELLSARRKFTAVLAFNDMSAIGALNQFKQAGLQVPDDISIIGFDDVLAASVCSPALTTVRQPLREMGQRAVSELLEALSSSKKSGNVITMAPSLTIRGTTASARA
jgi:DNA-binding LacI/PurR family transcriptional regulator